MMLDGVRQVPSRLRRLWREAQSDAEMHYTGYRTWREHLRTYGIEDVTGLRILDVGGGERAQMSLLLAAAGAQVTSLDSMPIALHVKRPLMWLKLGRSGGPALAIRAVIRDTVHTFRYWRFLERRLRRPLPFRSVRLVQGNAERLPFADQSFDIVVSSAVWEHLADVEQATREVARVLRADGIASIQIALFPALQGGHHAEWHSTDPRTKRVTRPWDHLYPDRKALPTYLNEWRESQYRQAFGRWLDVLEWQDGELRGDDLLTNQIRQDLTRYSPRDLLLSAITAWARPRSEPRSTLVDDRGTGRKLS